jgi:hypothetical protein
MVTLGQCLGSRIRVGAAEAGGGKEKEQGRKEKVHRHNRETKTLAL